MASKAERKAQAREERLAREQERLAAERRRRLITFGGVIIAAIAVVAIVIAVSSGGSNSGGGAGSPKAASAVSALLAGIPQSGATLGKPSAPVTVTIYADLECPVCREFTLTAEHKLIANEVRQGRAKLVFRSLQTATGDPATFQFQQQAAVAAGRQNKEWYFVELFYDQQGAEGTPYVTESYIDKLAHQIPGFDYSAWLAARKQSNLSAIVSADEKTAQRKGFNSTPTIEVSGPKGAQQPIAGAADYATLSGLVKKAGG